MRLCFVMLRCAALAVVLGACGESGTTPRPEARLLERYVALGNSITAGYESDGINDSTQANAYPVLLAARFGRPMELIGLRRPGCPPPLLGPITTTTARVGGAQTGVPCAGLVTPLPAAPQNLAIPGLRIAGVLTVPAGPLGAVYGQLFQNRSPLQVALDQRPTLVTAWLGNNDALSAVISGDATGPTRLTPLASFQASLNAIVAALDAQSQLVDVVLIGVADPQLAPVSQPGAYFWLARQDPAVGGFIRKPVHENCSPLLASGQRNALAANLVSYQVLADGAVREVSCADDAPYVLSAAERQAVRTRVGEFNQALRAAASARGWLYLDVDAAFGARLSDPAQLRKCQGLDAAVTPAQLRAALLASCPGPSAPNFFGELFSFDAVHPSRAGQQVIADAIAAVLRAKYPAL